MTACRVLLVEDDPASRELARRVIADLGHSVVTAADGPEGLALLEAHAPDVLVVDMHLPRLDGWSVASSARRSYPQLRIVGVSAGQAGERERALSAGCDVFVEKPYDFRTLRAALG